MTPKQLRGLRARAGLSQAAFARVCHVGEGTISRWERETGGKGRKIHPLSAVGIIGCLNRAFGYRLEAKDYV